jgi:predicted nucleic acid-binding protein
VTPVFLDTVGLLALWVQSDQWHGAAEAAYQQILTARRPRVTTTFVLLECGNSAARKPFRQDVVNLERELARRNSLIVPTDQDWANAWAAYERGRAGDPGIVDCVSMAVMRQLGLTDVFSNDQHFAAAGFTTLF